MGIRETAFGVLETGRISLPTMINSVFGRLSPEVCDARLAGWARRIVANAEIDLTVRGRQHAETQEPFVVMSNHQSLFDVPILYLALPGRLRMVAKAELFKVPIWGQAMLAAGFIRIDRADRRQAVESLRAGGAQLKDGTRIWIAPEGTRSVTGALGEFKSGGFRLALETGTRILPVAIDGTRHVLPAQGYVVQKGKRVVVHVLAPVNPRTHGVEHKQALMAEVRDAIGAALASSEADATA